MAATWMNGIKESESHLGIYYDTFLKLADLKSQSVWYDLREALAFIGNSKKSPGHFVYQLLVQSETTTKYCRCRRQLWLPRRRSQKQEAASLCAVPGSLSIEAMCTSTDYKRPELRAA